MLPRCLALLIALASLASVALVAEARIVPVEGRVDWRVVWLPPNVGAITALDALSGEEVWLAALEDSVNVGVFRLHDGVWAEMAKYSSWQIADIDMLSPDEGWLVGSDNYPFGRCFFIMAAAGSIARALPR